MGCASPSTVVEMQKRKLRIHRLSMRPQEIQQLWGMLQMDPKMVSQIFNGASISSLQDHIGVRLS